LANLKILSGKDVCQIILDNYNLLLFNEGRFPPDFMLRLNKKEKNELVTNCDRFQRLKHSSALPCAFTEQGVAMLSSVLSVHEENGLLN